MTSQSQPSPPRRRRGLSTLIGVLAIGLVIVLAALFAGPMLIDLLRAQQERLAEEFLLLGPTPTPTTPPPTPTVLPDFVEVIHNDEWTPVIREFGGVPMALVPAGCFLMGSYDEPDERPPHQVCFERRFWIDVYEVTNGQFGSAGTWTSGGLPREMVSWLDAVAHCARRNARLPTEAEWEYAARGPDSLAYPWGNIFNPDLVVFDDNSGARTNPVGSRPGGASWVGALDMSGNVWEWTSSLYMPYPYDPSDGREVSPGLDSTSERVMRGGSWGSLQEFTRAAARLRKSPDTATFFDGFRCVRDDE